MHGPQLGDPILTIWLAHEVSDFIMYQFTHGFMTWCCCGRWYNWNGGPGWEADPWRCDCFLGYTYHLSFPQLISDFCVPRSEHFGHTTHCQPQCDILPHFRPKTIKPVYEGLKPSKSWVKISCFSDIFHRNNVLNMLLDTKNRENRK